MKIIAILTQAETAHACLDAALVASRIDIEPQIVALHVIVDPDSLRCASEEVQIQRLRETWEGTAKERALATQAAFTAWNAHRGADTPVEWRAITGSEEATITQQAIDADLLVMAQGHSMDTGDARHAAIRTTRKPLLLVPGRWKPRVSRFSHVAVALSNTAVTDDAIDSAEPWLRTADKVTALRIGTEQDRALTRMDRLLHAGIKPRLLIVAPEGHDRGAQIVGQAEAIGADLLVAGAYRHGELVEWLMGGTTRHMLAATRLPLFLAH